MNDQGMVYVPVEADESMPMMMNATGSQGQFVGDYVIMWKKDGGVTGTFGWPDGYTPTETSTPEEINAAISNRWTHGLDKEGRNKLFKDWFPVCAQLN